MTWMPVRGVFPSSLARPEYAISGGSNAWSFSTVTTIDAANEKYACIGHIYWDGAPAAAKTMDSTSKIYWRTGTVTFADAGTNIRIGLQDVSTSGPPIQPDGTFDVYKDLAGNNGVITSSSDNVVVSVTLDTSGSKSVTHGDIVCIVWDMTARAGSDSMTFTQIFGTDRQVFPLGIQALTSWAFMANAYAPMAMLEASDGTLGVLAPTLFISQTSYNDYAASTATDERGLIFQVPYRCKVDGATIALANASSSTASDFDIVLYSAPLGTPVAMVTKSILGEQISADRPRYCTFMFAEQVLEPNTDYCLAVQAKSTGSVRLAHIVLGNENWRGVNGLANCRMGGRADGTGAFTETTTDIPQIFLNISAVDLPVGQASLNIGI